MMAHRLYPQKGGTVTVEQLVANINAAIDKLQEEKREAEKTHEFDDALRCRYKIEDLTAALKVINQYGAQQ